MIVTALTEMFGLKHPIILAPMDGVSGGHLAAAVSNAGGLGLVGGGYGDPVWLRTELSRAKEATRRPWGIGLITWSIDRSVFDLALSYRPDAFMLSFGDPWPYAPAIKAAGCKLICQVQGLEEARLAQEAGADIIVAQGTEGGGHGGGHATLPLVPAVVDAVAPTPVVAAGGIADGRGLAAALMLGAHGALIGTRFYASPEAGHRAVLRPRVPQALPAPSILCRRCRMRRSARTPTSADRVLGSKRPDAGPAGHTVGRSTVLLKGESIMRRSAAFVALAALAITPAFAGAPQTVVLDVQNMTCALCPLTVKKSLQQVPGVADAKVDLDQKTARFDPDRTSAAVLVRATTNAGYPSTLHK